MRSDRLTEMFRRMAGNLTEKFRDATRNAAEFDANMAQRTEIVARGAWAGDPIHAHRVRAAYQPSALEQAARTLEVDKPRPLSGGFGANFLGRSIGGGHSVYKPSYLETLLGTKSGKPLRYGIPRGGGHLAAREQAAFRVDEALRFGRIPPTAVTNGAYGPGSNQLWVYSTVSYPKAAQLSLPRHERPSAAPKLRKLNARYPRTQREQMAVLDYVIGNTDRHLNNYRTGPEGDIVAIDHGLTFPESPDPRYGIRSDFVAEFHHVPLGDEVMRHVRAVDVEQLRIGLLDSGLSEKAVRGALDRLGEIRDNGMITGEKWPGEINPGSTHLAPTGALPSGWIET